MRLIHLTTEEAAQGILEEGFQERQRERSVDNMPDGVDPWLARWSVMAAPIMGGQLGKDMVSLTIPHPSAAPWVLMVKAVYPGANLVAVEIDVPQHLWEIRHIASASGCKAEHLGHALEVIVDRKILNSLPMEIKQLEELEKIDDKLYKAHNWRGWVRGIMKWIRCTVQMRQLPKKDRAIAKAYSRYGMVVAILSNWDSLGILDENPILIRIRKCYTWWVVRQYNKCMKFELDELDREWLTKIKISIDALQNLSNK